MRVENVLHSFGFSSAWLYYHALPAYRSSMARDNSEIGRSQPTPSEDIAKVKTVACLGGVSLERDVPSEEISDYIRDPSNLVWMDVQDPGPAELSMLSEEF